MTYVVAGIQAIMLYTIQINHLEWAMVIRRGFV